MSNRDQQNMALSGRTIPLWNHLSYSQRETAKRVTLYALLIPPLVAILFPLYWMFVTSIRPQGVLYDMPQSLLPVPATFDVYREILTDPEFIQFYTNSIIVSAGVVLLTTTTATLGGYGLTRLDIPYKKMFARGVLMGYMFPAIMLSIPMFVLWSNLRMLNTYVGLILAETAIALPFGLWLMWNFFQTVPLSLEESALTSGATRFHAFKDIALPMATPGIIAVAIFAYAVSWNEYTMPTVLMTRKEMWPLTVGIQTFTEGYNILWNEVMAATTLMVIPSFIFVFFLQSYILQGFRLE